MDLPSQYRVFAKYNRWMNEKLYALAATLSDEERKRDLGAFFRSIHGSLNHLLLTDRVQLGRFTSRLRKKAFPQPASLSVVSPRRGRTIGKQPDPSPTAQDKVLSQGAESRRGCIGVSPHPASDPGITSLLQTLDAGGNPVPIRSLDQELYSNFDTLRRERARTDLAIEKWASGLTIEKLSGSLRYRAMLDGREYEHPLWWAVSHFFNHQTHHRGQITTLLMQLGKDPGVTDLMAMLRSTPS